MIFLAFGEDVRLIGLAVIVLSNRLMAGVSILQFDYFSFFPLRFFPFVFLFPPYCFAHVSCKSIGCMEGIYAVLYV